MSATMQKRLIAAAKGATSWGGAYISEAQIIEIVSAVLQELRTPDEAMLMAGEAKADQAERFAAMVDSARPIPREPKTVPFDVVHRVSEVVIGNYKRP